MEIISVLNFWRYVLVTNASTSSGLFRLRSISLKYAQVRRELMLSRRCLSSPLWETNGIWLEMLLWGKFSSYPWTNREPMSFRSYSSVKYSNKSSPTLYSKKSTNTWTTLPSTNMDSVSLRKSLLVPKLRSCVHACSTKSVDLSSSFRKTNMPTSQSKKF